METTHSSRIPPFEISAMSEQAFQTDHQVVLLLVGLIGSGKSTFAQALEQHYPQFRRCNQDDLGGDRRRVEAAARHALRQGLSACIDRTNIDVEQRRTWINISREFPGTHVWVIVLDTPYETCIERLRERTDHPTIKTPQQGFSILSRFRSQFAPPISSEGHTRLLRLKPSDHPSAIYTPESVGAILRRLQASELEPGPYAPIESYFISNHRRGGPGLSGHRGRGSHEYRGGQYRGGQYRGGPQARGHSAGGRGQRSAPYYRGRAGAPSSYAPRGGLPAYATSSGARSNGDSMASHNDGNGQWEF
ncbi:hypothetical protein CERSUDRAFT_116853 [Gelatoporia subvermispora B]|uniref:P-loop containing nucleoside triphosphate hydrolase protein n=1 Tax=Ceriporiopsis subvermispora (strain B) TaxID=914234 RepID=M2R7K1_CERS8|nr:hypothetical protein CERSUDRAFT_116853 [Gelatoporia subvermispora B]